ncbi:MAG: LptF/LptG family permease, partial [Bacteroidota bacterium]
LRKLKDSLKVKIDTVKYQTYRTALGYFNYQLEIKRDSASVADRKDLLKTFTNKLPDTLPQYDTWPTGKEKVLYDKALSKVRSFKNVFSSASGRNRNYAKEGRRAIFDMHYKYTLAVACFIMFVIGAPLGSIIKKGGLGLPVLVSVFFYIIQYVMNITGKKWSREALVPVEFGAWYGMVILFAVGVFFFIQARSDSRVFEQDVYLVQWYRFRKWLFRRLGRENEGDK